MNTGRLGRPHAGTRRMLPDGSIERRCRGCGEWKPLEQMTKQSGCIDGRAPRCKVCDNVRWEMRAIRREERKAS